MSIPAPGARIIGIICGGTQGLRGPPRRGRVSARRWRS
jgi:hypothetical protein